MSDVQISARIPREHEEALRRRAERNDRTLSAEVRRAIRLYVNDPNKVSSRPQTPSEPY